MTGLFLYLFSLHTISAIIEFVLMYTLCIRFGQAAVSKKRVAGIFAIVSLGIGLLNTALTITQIQMNHFFYYSYGMLFYFLFVNIVQVAALKKVIKRTSGAFVFLMVTIISALSELCANTTEVLKVYDRAFEAAETYLQKFFVRLPFYLLTFVLLYALLLLLRRPKCSKVIRAMTNYPKACISIAIIMVVTKMISTRLYSNVVVLFGNDPNLNLYLLFFAAVIVMVILLVHSYVSEVRRNELKMALVQQTDYVRRLEEIQKKLRVINHDYKNVAAGLYLKASDGDIEAVKKYVNNQLLKIDQEIQVEVSQMNQLINMKDVELKGLIITKIAEAAEKGVAIYLEINGCVNTINMPAGDLLRCLGILIDNAIEGAEEVNERVVKLVITEDNKIVTALIKNQYEGEVSLHQIFSRGYSSKGESRGLGLYSLKKILTKHPHVFLETKLEEGWFVQLIKII